MEPFLRKRLTCLSFLWNKIWPAGDSVSRFPDPDTGAELEPPAAEPCVPPGPGQLFRVLHDFTAQCRDELSVRHGDRLLALREESGYIFALRLSRRPSMGLVPIACVAGATSDPLSDHA